MQKKFSGIGMWIAALLVFMFIWSFAGGMINSKTHTDYSDLISELKQGSLHSLTIDGNTATYTFTEEKRADGTYPKYTTQIPSAEVLRADVGDDILNSIAKTGMIYEVKKQGISLWSILTPILTIVAVIFVWMMIMQQQNGGKAGGFTRNRARLAVADKNKIGCRSG